MSELQMEKSNMATTTHVSKSNGGKTIMKLTKYQKKFIKDKSKRTVSAWGQATGKTAAAVIKKKEKEAAKIAEERSKKKRRYVA